MQNNPYSRRVREIFPAFLGKVRKKAPAHRVQGLWNSFLLAVCQQVLDLLQGVDDAGNGHIVVQGHHKVGSVLGNIHVHIPVAGQCLSK